MIVVADASPICYLLLIGHVDLLQRLFGQVVIPQAVYNELSVEGAPTIVRSWIAHPPSWLQIQYATTTPDASLDRLHLGEREAITLATQLKQEFVQSFSAPACTVVSAAESTLKARRQAEAIYRKMNEPDNPVEARANLLIYVPRPRGTTSEARRRDPFEVFAVAGVAFGDTEGERLASLARQAMPERIDEIKACLPRGAPAWPSSIVWNLFAAGHSCARRWVQNHRQKSSRLCSARKSECDGLRS
jgi:hypothetical protein